MFQLVKTYISQKIVTSNLHLYILLYIYIFPTEKKEIIPHQRKLHLLHHILSSICSLCCYGLDIFFLIMEILVLPWIVCLEIIGHSNQTHLYWKKKYRPIVILNSNMIYLIFSSHMIKAYNKLVIIKRSMI